MINRYETANAIAGYAAPGVYDALKNVLEKPAAEEKKADKPAASKLIEFDDEVVLQVNGVPVFVNPESLMNQNNQAAGVDLGLVKMEIGPDEVSVAQKKATKDIDDKEMKDSISQFNSKLVELKKRFKF